MKTSILILATFLASCGSTKFITVPLVLPPQPEYVKVSGDELQCLSEDAYIRLAKSVKQRNAHIETLEDIIRSTHAAQ